VQKTDVDVHVELMRTETKPAGKIVLAEGRVLGNERKQEAGPPVAADRGGKAPEVELQGGRAWSSGRSEALQRGKERCVRASDESERMKSGGGRRE
jgi:hypothetical protein